MGFFALPEKPPVERLKTYQKGSNRTMTKVAIVAALVVGGLVAALDYAPDKEINYGNVAVAGILAGATAAGTKAALNQPGSTEAIALAVRALEDAAHQQERLTVVLEEHRRFAGAVKRELAETRAQNARLSAKIEQFSADLDSNSSLLIELLSQRTAKPSAPQPLQPPDEYWTAGLEVNATGN